MFFSPKPVPKRVSRGVLCLMLIMLGVALFAGFDLMGTVESRGPEVRARSPRRRHAPGQAPGQTKPRYAPTPS